MWLGERRRGLSFTASAKQSNEKELQVRKCYFIAEFVPLSKARSIALLHLTPHSLHQFVN